MRSAYFHGTSGDTDLLASSVIEKLGAGTYTVYAVSTVTTATLTCSDASIVLINGAALPAHADATEVQVDVSREIPYSFYYSGTGTPTIAIGGTTGTWSAVVIAENASIPGQ